MINHSNTEPDSKEELQDDQSETSFKPESDSKQDSGHPRRSGRSKREIMEELSRARFPWDE